jgi:thioredoxin reductase
MKQDTPYDVIIVGGSYAGLAAGMALGRALRKVLIVDSGNPCNKQTPHSHNFLTNDGRAPKEITDLARQEIRQYPTVNFLDAFATGAFKRTKGFEIQTQEGERFTAKKILLATGIKDMMPDIPGFAECWGITVLHCPYCHGYEVRHQKTGVLANGDSGFELASLISNWTDDLALYTNGRSTLSEAQTNKLQRHKINIVETEIALLEHHNGNIRNIQMRDGTGRSAKALYARLPFVQHSDVQQSLGCELTEEGYIKTGAAQGTTVHGVYACGDNASRMRTVANAVSMGTTAALMVNKEIIEDDF